MPDIVGPDTALPVPTLLERQGAQYLINPPPHLSNAPAGPAPELGWHEIRHRNAMKVGPPGQPPMESGVIYEHHRIGTVMGKEAVGLGKQAKKNMTVGEDARKPHHRQFGERVEEPASFGPHPFAAEADALNIRLQPAKGPNKIGPVKIAARFARTDENTHRHPFR